MAGSTNIVAKRDISVPIPKNNPIEDITDDAEINPIRKPAISKIKPLVITAGSLSSKVFIIDSFLSYLTLSCL